ncbi:MAG TPA: TonB-dependent receptor, partial [Bacteroidia bacterium]|nr:TonB-dependent receptor [Bacteroidia bacterium]
MLSKIDTGSAHTFTHHINMMREKIFSKVFILAILLLAFSIGANAQKDDKPDGAKITGKIVDATTGQAVGYASISLAQQSDGKEINGTTTDDQGAFSLTGVQNGTYKLLIYSVNYITDTINNIIVSKGKTNTALGAIKLKSTSTALKTVQITADKSYIENKIDKMVYNVDKDITSQTGVATDALKKIPEVDVDVDGNVQLQGNSNIRFLINGKPSSIFGNNIADVLASIPASQIQSIEVITSPGAKYDAEGTGGIINIILKKSTAQGINSNVSLSGGTRLENGSFNLNARKGHFGAHAYVSGNGQIPSHPLTSTNRTGQDTGSTTSQLIENGSGT